MFSLLSLLVSLTSAQAQNTHCWVVTYSDNGTGTWSYVNPNYTPPAQSGKWTPGSSGCSFGGTDDRNGSIQGTVTATLTWVPAIGQTMQTDPPPSPVTIIEQGDAYENSLLGTDPNTQGPAGSASDGLNDTPVVTGNGYTSSGYHALSPQDGSSGTIALSGVTLSAQNPIYSVTNGYPPYTRWPSGQTAVGLSIILPPPLLAHSTVDSANWDAMRPRFFSGTNCSVSGTAMAYSAPLGGSSYVTSAQLQIGSTTVKQYTDTGTHQSSVPLSVFFDSTYFANRKPILAQMTVTDSGGLTYTVSLSGPACNSVLAVANQTSSWIDVYTNQNVAENAASGVVQGTPSQPNFQPYPGVVPQTASTHFDAQAFDAHHKADIASDIACQGLSFPWTVFFAATHSNHGLLGDCYSTSNSDAATTYLSDADIQAAVANKAAGPNPQPYLFVQVHGCDGGGSTTLANDFGIPTSSSDDRAFVGFGVTIAVNQRNTNFTVALWHYLLSGQKIDLAQKNANTDFPIQVYIDQNTKPNDNPGNTTIPVVYGDNNMTLNKKVYNWTSGPTWYR